MTEDQVKSHILLGSHLENFKWAKELSETLGNEYPKTIKVWKETNKIVEELQKLKHEIQRNNNR